MDFRYFYVHPSVKERILDFLKGDRQGKISASYVLGLPAGAGGDERFSSAEEDFSWIWSGEYRIFRSLLDTENILCPFFLKSSQSSKSYSEEDIFRFLEPAYKSVIALFYRFDMEPLPLMLNQGYLFIAREPLNSRGVKELEKIGNIADTLQERYAVSMGKRHRSIPIHQGRAHEGMSRIMEYFAHRAIKEIRKRTSKPVCLYESFQRAEGRAIEAFYIDMDIYSDPLYLKVIDIPFSFSLNSREEKSFVLPRDSFTSLDQLLRIRKDTDLIGEYSKNINTLIPECRFGLRNLIRSYKGSRLYQFHKVFDSVEHDAYWEWKNTYDKYSGDSIPGYVNNMIKNPNPALLKLANIQLLTKVLMRDNWHPKHVAGLIRSKYERDHGWGALWYEYDASTRANFFVRLMAGLLVDGTDMNRMQ